MELSFTLKIAKLHTRVIFRSVRLRGRDNCKTAIGNAWYAAGKNSIKTPEFCHRRVLAMAHALDFLD